MDRVAARARIVRPHRLARIRETQSRGAGARGVRAPRAARLGPSKTSRQPGRMAVHRSSPVVSLAIVCAAQFMVVRTSRSWIWCCRRSSRTSQSTRARRGVTHDDAPIAD